MYIELFLLDNFFMDYLVVRMAAVMIPCRMSALRFTLAAAVASVAAALVVAFLPAESPICAAVGLLLIPALPHATPRQALTSALAVYASAFAVGGAAIALAYAFGGGLSGGLLIGGLPVRLALMSIAAALALPPVFKGIISRRARGRVSVRFTHDGEAYSINGAIDSCNTLTDPFSGLPVIVLYCPKLRRAATLCLPIHTVGGDGAICGFVPSGLEIRTDGEWRRVSACVALSATRPSVGGALVPAVLVMEENV